VDLICSLELEAFWRGDARLFRRIVEAASPRLLGSVRPYVRDLDEARDLVQETWHRAFLRRKDFRGDGSLVGWLLAIARNVARAHVRAPASRFESRTEIGESPGNPESDLEVLELRRALLNAVDELPERERETLVHRLVLELSTRETAARLGCAEGTVKAALSHAVVKLREAMKEWRR
jgi:RNA polymerase sigma-70 factor, ECF subfamily